MRVLFEYEKSTKGAHRYKEVDDESQPIKINEGAQIGTLYIRRTALVQAHQFIMVTITELAIPAADSGEQQGE